MSRPLREERDTASRSEFLRAVEEAGNILARCETGSPDARKRLARHRGALAAFPERLTASEARVAFVGSVKSGKSTLINALLGQDLVPRGAGVLTTQVTEIHAAEQPALALEWRSAVEADRDFTRLMVSLGQTGSWHLAETAHRDAARDVLAAVPITTQNAEELEAMLKGYPEFHERLGRREERHAPSEIDVRHWATRDEVAAFLRRLHVYTTAPQLHRGFSLIDCQGYDAWNPAHAGDLLAALQRSHALVYVVSSRVGLRDADFRLLEQIRGFGLLPLTRFVLNVDWGEIRRPEELDRVRRETVRRLRELHRKENPKLHEFSALQALLEHLALYRPEGLTPGERRLLDAWDTDSAAGFQNSREQFRHFREQIRHEAGEERERTLLRRLRAELRHLLVAVSGEVRHAGAEESELARIGWEDDASERFLGWAQERLDGVAAECKNAIRRQVHTEFGARRAPQRLGWTNLLQEPSLQTTSPWAAALLEALQRNEAVRVNAVRNHALVARGELARRGEELGRDMARRLAEAGVEPAPPPGRALLSREIDVTREIPQFSRVAARVLEEPEEPDWFRRTLGALGRTLQRGNDPGPGRRVRAATAGAVRRRLLGKAWQLYLDRLLGQCLLPHVDEAAARVYAALAAWFVAQLHPDGRVETALGILESADPEESSDR